MRLSALTPLQSLLCHVYNPSKEAPAKLMTDAPTVLTGIKPTGHPHVGNYAGMIRPTLDMITENSDGQNYLFIAIYHALNTIKTQRIFGSLHMKLPHAFLLWDSTRKKRLSTVKAMCLRCSSSMPFLHRLRQRA